MSEYRANLLSSEVKELFAELELPVNPEVLSMKYYGWKWTCLRSDDFPLILNVLPPSGYMNDLFWEEWYIQKGTMHHHILTLSEPETYHEIFTAPESDDIHPPEVFSKTWFVVDDKNIEPVLMR